MREILREWIINLTLFSLLSSVIIRLLPGKSYVPYIRIFCGIMTILTLFHPVFELTGLKNDLELYFTEGLLKAEQYEMEKELIQIEEEQKKELEKRQQQYLKDLESGE